MSWKPMKLTQRTGSIGLLVLVGCLGVDHPQGPNLDALAAIYDNPDGTFDAATVAEMRDALDSVLDGLEAYELPETADSMVDTLGDAFGDGGATRPMSEVEIEDNTFVIEGEAFVTIKRICAGWVRPAVADEELNGTLTLMGGLTDAGLDRSMWAEANGCRYIARDDNVTLDAGSRDDIGDLRIFFGDDASFDRLDEVAPLFEVDMSGRTGAEVASLRFDFRRSSDGLETRVEVASGNLIVISSDRAVISVRAANGTFVCEPSTAICTNEDGDEVALAD